MTLGAQTPDGRPWTRWWWPGSAVDKAGVTAQLEAFAAAGLGGVEITPIYGAQGAEHRYLDYLSAEWRAALIHTLREAERLNLRVDMATGTGWPFGGATVAPADGSSSIRWDKSLQTLTGEATNMQVKRAAPGATGLVLDPYSPAALSRYLATFDEPLAALPSPGLRSQFHDSFEYYGATWTAALSEAFLTEHGYDLNDYGSALLAEEPAAAGIAADTLARVKHDYRTTLGHLHLQYLNTWREWSHRHGWLVRNQSHGAPANLLDLYGAVDIPETETFGSTPFPIPGLRRDERFIRGNDDLPEPLMMKMASSAAHVMGRPLVSSETCTWLREHWRVSPAMAKPEIDRLLANGINHIVYHGSVYSPTDAAWPGWLFYASTQFNPSNPWWRDFGALNAYVTRIQSRLQRSAPDNDILLYWPYADVTHDPVGLTKMLTVHHVDWLTASDFGQTARQLTAAGFTFDYISDAQLEVTRVSDRGLLQTPGHHYRALVVPPVQHLPLPTLRKVLALRDAGASVTFLAPPADVPGLARLDERRKDLADLMQSAEFQNALLQGKLSDWLVRQGAVAEPMTRAGLEFIRRRRPAPEGGHVYFITNLTAHAFHGDLPLGHQSEIVAMIDPLDGRAWRPDTDTPQAHLAPGQSLLVETYSRETTATLPEPSPLLQPAKTAVELTSSWRLDFVAGGPALPASVELPQPVDWTTLPDPELQRFAGTGRYSTRFTLSVDDHAAATDWLLDLGDVRETARVFINGTEVGVSWSVPHQLRIGAHLRAGTNHLAIEVSNLAANRIRDLDRREVPWRTMHEINFVNIHYRRFNAADWPDTPSGLLAPVRLIPLVLAE